MFLHHLPVYFVASSRSPTLLHLNSIPFGELVKCWELWQTEHFCLQHCHPHSHHCAETCSVVGCGSCKAAASRLHNVKWSTSPLTFGPQTYRGAVTPMFPSSQSPHHPVTLDYSLQVQFHLKLEEFLKNHCRSKNLLFYHIHSSKYIFFGINFRL